MTDVDKLIKLINNTMSGKPKTEEKPKQDMPAKCPKQERHERQTRDLARQWAMFF